jgi:cytochrome c553
LRKPLAVAIGLALTLAAGVAGAGPLDAPGYAKAYACSACHGLGGNSKASATPVLAGMPAWYFKKAIEDYASGKRPSAEMEPYAKQALELGVSDIAAYFAAQRREPTRIALDPAAVERGRQAARPCEICHGPRGEGDPARLIPDLRGQPPGYLRHQMVLFKEDKRSPGDERLRAIKALMKTIPDATLADLAAYYSSVR